MKLRFDGNCRLCGTACNDLEKHFKKYHPGDKPGFRT